MGADLREASEKRRYRREPVRRAVYARKGDDVLGGTVLDVSATGVRMHFPAADADGLHGLKLGDTVTLVLEALSSKVEGHVIRISGDEVALAFDGLTAETEAALARGIADAAGKQTD